MDPVPVMGMKNPTGGARAIATTHLAFRAITIEKIAAANHATIVITRRVTTHARTTGVRNCLAVVPITKAIIVPTSRTARFNRTIKERVHINYNMLPYQHLLPICIIAMVYHTVFWRNMFALKGGISDTQSPSELVLNRKLNFNALCKVEFGQYVQTHKKHINEMQPRNLGAIATRPSNNAGAYNFISLSTSWHINRHSWTVHCPECSC